MHRTPEEKMNCKSCENYSLLIMPRELKEGVIIYGYCFKQTGFTNTGYPVYIPEGKCKSHKPLPGKEAIPEGQLSFEDYLGVMP